MADVEITRSHDLGVEGARAAVSRVARDLRQSVPFQHRWEGDALVFEGSGANGRIDVHADRVDVAVRLGLLLKAMRPAVRREAERLLDEHLHP